jgi:hypothetical protein
MEGGKNDPSHAQTIIALPMESAHPKIANVLPENVRMVTLTIPHDKLPQGVPRVIVVAWAPVEGSPNEFKFGACIFRKDAPVQESNDKTTGVRECLTDTVRKLKRMAVDDLTPGVIALIHRALQMTEKVAVSPSAASSADTRFTGELFVHPEVLERNKMTALQRLCTNPCTMHFLKKGAPQVPMQRPNVARYVFEAVFKHALPVRGWKKERLPFSATEALAHLRTWQEERKKASGKGSEAFSKAHRREIAARVRKDVASVMEQNPPFLDFYRGVEAVRFSLPKTVSFEDTATAAASGTSASAPPIFVDDE